jgi:formimidoylglutamate deiminase
MHLEEQPAEIEQCRAAFAGRSPLRVLLDAAAAASLASLDHCTLVHCTHSNAAEMREFIALGGTVCVCPLTEAALADGLSDLASMRGRVCLGTDCNARIDFLEEMRWLEYGQRVRTLKRGSACRQGRAWVPDLSRELLRFATASGADALKADVGVVAAGRWADFCLLDIDGAEMRVAGVDGDATIVAVKEILPTVIFGHARIVNTCVGGHWRKKLIE